MGMNWHDLAEWVLWALISHHPRRVVMSQTRLLHRDPFDVAWEPLLCVRRAQGELFLVRVVAVSPVSLEREWDSHRWWPWLAWLRLY